MFVDVVCTAVLGAHSCRCHWLTFLIAEGIATAYGSTSTMLMFSQAFMMLEILHSVFGLVKSSVGTVFLQVRLYPI